MIDKVKRANSNWSVFPNRNSLAYYSFFTQSIHLNSVEKNQIDSLFEIIRNFDKGIDAGMFSTMRKTLSVLHHEYRHWIDCISTVWGTALLQKIYEANIIRIKGTSYGSPVDEMHKIKDLHDLIRRMHYSSYYTTKFNVENQFPWRTKYSMGKLFTRDGKVSNYPIFFTRFSTRDDDQDICRVPFGLSSVFEASAMADEYRMDMMALSLMKEDDRLIETTLYGQETINNIYNKDLGAYLVAGHHVANCVKINNVQSSFDICSKLGRIVLNFPIKLFSKLIINNELLQIISDGNNDEIWLRGIKTAFDHHDRAILFFLIALLLPVINDNETLTDEYIESIIKIAFGKMNIEFEELVTEANAEFHENMQAIWKQNVVMGNYIVKKGSEVFESLGLFGKSSIGLADLAPIPVILGDDTIYDPYQGVKDLGFDLHNYVSKGLEFEHRLYEFCEACIF